MSELPKFPCIKKKKKKEKKRKQEKEKIGGKKERKRRRKKRRKIEKERGKYSMESTAVIALREQHFSIGCIIGDSR